MGINNGFPAGAADIRTGDAFRDMRVLGDALMLAVKAGLEEARRKFSEQVGRVTRTDRKNSAPRRAVTGSASRGVEE
jgi:hypothetical protein